MTTPHTPEPWVLDHPSRWYGLAARITSKDNHELIASVSLDVRGENVGLANAHLIAAALELLQACRWAEEYLRYITQDGADTDELSLLANLRAAIDKATGKDTN